MEPRDVKEVEQIIDLKTRKEKREKRRHRNYILSEALKCIFLLIVAMISAAIIVPLTEAAPEKALLIYECFAIVLIIIFVSFWLDKPRRKK